jgi:uncharacterized membrane protein
VTKAFIVMAVIAIIMVLYFMVPQVKAGVHIAWTTITMNLTLWAAAFEGSEFYLTIIAPRLWQIAAVIGALLGGFLVFIAARGWLSFIKYGRDETNRMVGYQGAPVYQPGAPAPPVQAQPIPTPPEQEETA